MSSTDILGTILDTCTQRPNSFTDAIIHEGYPIIVQTPAGNHPISGLDTTPIARADVIKLAEQVIETHAMLRGVKTPDVQAILEKGAVKVALDFDSAYSPNGTRLRFTIVRVRGGRELAAIIRHIPQVIPQLSTLGMPSPAMGLTRGAGLVLLTGPTKQGKSTTAASMLQEIRDSRPGHIVTIEDPIEYSLPSAADNSCPVTSREVGPDVKSYIEGAEDALRMNPTTIMIGEIRDAETARAALNLGESGHLVLSTMQSTTAEGAIYKLWSLMAGYPGAQLSIATCLRGVIRTCLVPNVDRTRYVPAYEFILNRGDFAKAISTIGAHSDTASVRNLLSTNGRLAHGQSLKYALQGLEREKKISAQAAKAFSNDAGYED